MKIKNMNEIIEIWDDLVKPLQTGVKPQRN
jgi:hypothetical protein